MSDYSDISVELVSNDGTETFLVPADTISFNGEESFTTEVIGAVDQSISAVDFELERQERVVTGVIGENIPESAYPGSLSGVDDMHAYASQLENILGKDEWNTLLTGKTAKLKWDRGGLNQEFDVIVTNVNTDFFADRNRYEFSIELTEVDAVFTVDI